MKLSIDTTNKTLQVEGSVSLLEFTEALERMFPNGLWKTFKLETNTVVVWTNPVQLYPYYPYYPWWGTTTVTDMGTEKITYTLTSGTYNVEI